MDEIIKKLTSIKSKAQTALKIAGALKRIADPGDNDEVINSVDVPSLKAKGIAIIQEIKNEAEAIEL